MISSKLLAAHVGILGVLTPATAYFLSIVSSHPEWSEAPGYSEGFNSLHMAALFGSIPGLVLLEPVALVTFIFSAAIFSSIRQGSKVGKLLFFSLVLPFIRLVFDVVIQRNQSLVFDFISTGLFALLVIIFTFWRSLSDFANRSKNG
jgi:hypothetical protein